MRRLQLTVLVFAICCLCLPIWGQIPSVDLSQYARPILSRKSLDLSLQGKGQHSQPGLRSNNSQTRFTGLSGNMNVRYQSLSNTPKLQENTLISLGINPDIHQQSRGIRSQVKNRRFQSHLLIRSDRLRYLSSSFFFGLTTQLDYRSDVTHISSRKVSLINELEEVDNQLAQHRLKLDMQLTVGHGRIEQVEDAQHALFILHALERRGYVTRELTEGDVLGFAARISQLKNRRYFDFRLQKIWELEQIHTFLREQDMVDQEEAAVGLYAIVQDMWNYGFLAPRLAGRRASIGIDPNIRMSNQTYADFDRYQSASHDTSIQVEGGLRSIEFAPALYVSYVSEQPWKQSWQRSISLEAEYGMRYGAFRHRKTEDMQLQMYTLKEWFFPPYLQLVAHYGIGYYPTSRTYIRGFLRANLFQAIQTPNAVALPGNRWRDQTYLGSQLSLNAYYYLSPAIRLEISYLASVRGTANLATFSPNRNFITAIGRNARIQQQTSVGLQIAWF
ncbi:MAG: hypothetical protein AAF587_27625 [Bacteroidota bacterium]